MSWDTRAVTRVPKARQGRIPQPPDTMSPRLEGLGHKSQLPRAPLELLSSEGAAPNLPQGRDPNSALRATLCHHPLCHAGSWGRWGQPGLAAVPAPGQLKAWHGAHGIFLSRHLLFEAVGSVFSAINTTLPCPAPLGDNSSTLSATAWLPWVTPRWPWDVWQSPNPLPVQGKPPLSPCQAGRSPRGSGHSGPCGFGALGCPHLELPKDGESGAVPALVTAVGVTNRAQLGTTTTTTRFLREKGVKNRD